MQGLIIGNKSNLYEVEAMNKVYETVARGKFKKDNVSLVVGDKVEIEVTDEQKKNAVILDVLPRNTYIKRPKLSNLTKLILVLSCKMPKPDLLLLDKQLAFAEYLGLDTVIVINKIDLENDEKIQELKEVYTNIGYKVIFTNAKLGQGVDNLKKELKGNISAFSGNSGVGKSTLINAIFKNNLSGEGDISKKNKRGKNTTTKAKLYKIDEDTYIADTPGFSTFDIYEIEKENLYKYFKEFKVFEQDCKFVGCTHIKEKECGIRNALQEGKIANTRYENYVKIYEDLKDKEEHKW